MIKFCENNYECRRVLLLNHLDEKFNKALCKGYCDNCVNNYDTEDINCF